MAAIVSPDAYHFPTVLLELVGIAHVLNLLESNLGRGVELELEDVDIPVSPDGHIHPSLAGVFFHFGIEAAKRREDIHHALEVPFLIRLELVGAIGEECLQTAHEAVDILAFYLTDEQADFESGSCFVDIGIVRNEELYETLFHFLVWVSQLIQAESLIIPLNGEVSTLVYHRDRIGGSRVDAVQFIGRRLFLLEIG